MSYLFNKHVNAAISSLFEDKPITVPEYQARSLKGFWQYSSSYRMDRTCEWVGVDWGETSRILQLLYELVTNNIPLEFGSFAKYSQFNMENSIVEQFCKWKLSDDPNVVEHFKEFKHA